jgi:hypothetical protein
MMKTPKLLLHKTSGRAYARLNRKFHWFGQYGTAESQQRFQQWLAEIHLKSDGTRATTLLLLSSRFMEHAKRHYCRNEVLRFQHISGHSPVRCHRRQSRGWWPSW